MRQLSDREHVDQIEEQLESGGVLGTVTTGSQLAGAVGASDGPAALTRLGQSSAIPLALSSSRAAAVFSRSSSPIARSTAGALENWTSR